MSLKSLREALCFEQTRGRDWPASIASGVDVLIEMIERHRPLGPDGRHDERHTDTCGDPHADDTEAGS